MIFLKRSVYFLLITIPTNLFAQTKVVDSLTKLPLTGVTISIGNSTVVQLTDDFGFID